LEEGKEEFEEKEKVLKPKQWGKRIRS